MIKWMMQGIMLCSEIHEMLFCVFYLIINMANIKCKTNHRKTEAQTSILWVMLSPSLTLTHASELFAFSFTYISSLCVFNLHYWTIGNWEEIPRRMCEMKFIKIIILSTVNLQTESKRMIEEDEEEKRVWNDKK